MPKGFYDVPGVQKGVRSLEDSIKGLELLWPLCKGSTVLDLGCAEGLITQMCIERGATKATGLDQNAGHLMKAKKWGKDLMPRGLSFGICFFNEPKLYPQERADIVLALSVIHKLRPDIRHHFLQHCCKLAKHWLFLRAPSRHIELAEGAALDMAKWCEMNEGMQLVNQRIITGQPWVGVFRVAPGP